MVSFARDGWTNYFDSSGRKMDYADSHFTQIGVPEWLMAFAQGQQPVCPVSGKTGKERLSA